MKRNCRIAVLAILVLCALLAGCGAASEPASYAAVEQDAAPSFAAPQAAPPATPQAAPDVAAGEAAGGEMPSADLPQDGRDIALTAWISLEATDFDAACQKIQAAAKERGGRFSAVSIFSGDSDGNGSRSASFTALVPAGGAYDTFVAGLGDAGKVITHNEQSDDVTDQVVDIEARLKSLRAQETRLLAMMEEAGELSDVILVQDQLAQVQYEIETYTASQRGLESRIRYATVHIEVREVRQLSETVEDNFFSQVGAAFRGSWQLAGDVLQLISLAVVWLLPLLLLAAAVLAIVLVCVRRHRRRTPQPPVPPTARPGSIPAPGAPYAPYGPGPAAYPAPPAAHFWQPGAVLPSEKEKPSGGAAPAPGGPAEKPGQGETSSKP